MMILVITYFGILTDMMGLQLRFTQGIVRRGSLHIQDLLHPEHHIFYSSDAHERPFVPRIDMQSINI